PLPPQAGTNTQDPKNRASSLPTATPTLAAGGASGGGQQNRGDIVGAVLRGAGIAAGVLALLALPGLVRLLVRRVRLRRLRTSGAADIGWREIVDTGTDLGRPPPKDVSPRATELVLQRELVGAAAAGSALARVRGAYERQTYGGHAERVSPDDVDTVLSTFRAGATRGRRLGAAVAPRSLVGRIAASRAAVRRSPPGSE
ncbi:MAG: hypothetical protein QOC59_321, partial [Microbacteriaceae bacterium]|nr:hypothetical protein [Microbacteriaceae bacterium]